MGRPIGTACGPSVMQRADLARLRKERNLRMHLEEEQGLLAVRAETYTLTFAADRPFVYLHDASGASVAELFVPSSVHTLQDRDDTVRLGHWEVTQNEDAEIVVSVEAASSVWESKTYRFRCHPQRFLYEVAVTGAGRLAEANYFGGYYSGQPRWGSGFFRSGQRFRKGFNPEPNSAEANYFPPAAGSVIDLTGVPLPGKAGWFFTPPPFCFAFYTLDHRWFGMGIEARPGENTYTELAYTGQLNSFYLTLAYEGHTAVDGHYELPAIGFDFGADEYDVLAAHVGALRAAGHIPASVTQQGGVPVRPAWWRQPIFCGWGVQCGHAALEGGRAPAYARQSVYDPMLAILDAQDICPGIVVLDDKWQATYGENAADPGKWPDLPRWIAHQHGEGRRVLLWLKAWDPEGVPVEECITNAGGLPLAVDPTHPAFEARLRASVRRMLGPVTAGGYDADGFKIDFSARIPSGPGIHTHGATWGLELMRLYLGIIYDEAKRVKPDALVIAHTPHPYLAGVLDMVRLNDINMGKDVVRAMRRRAAVAAIACPDALIDTDNWPIENKAEWRRYMEVQPGLGVPSLYYASLIDASREPFDADDYRLIRDVWERYRAGLA
jgi:hypothetical protein